MGRSTYGNGLTKMKNSTSTRIMTLNVEPMVFANFARTRKHQSWRTFKDLKSNVIDCLDLNLSSIELLLKLKLWLPIDKNCHHMYWWTEFSNTRRLSITVRCQLPTMSCTIMLPGIIVSLLSVTTYQTPLEMAHWLNQIHIVTVECQRRVGKTGCKFHFTNT